MALVAGRNRVPNPPTGKIALRTRFMKLSAFRQGDVVNGSPRQVTFL
jgi:hypothetical protein